MRELLEPDKINFVLAMIASAVSGYFFRTRMSPSRFSAEQRHLASFLGGVSLILLCFGKQIIHLFIPMTFVYSSIRLMNSSSAFILSSVFCMVYLTICHLWRMYFDYGGYELDITGPLMVLVQRLTMLAANIDDGESMKRHKNDRERLERLKNGALATSTPLNNSSKPANNDLKLSDNQKKLAILTCPSPLQFSSYCINFQTVIIGPLIPYRDYECFIRGTELENLQTHSEKQFFAKHRDEILAAKSALNTYAKQAIIYGILYIFVAGYFPTTFYLTDAFLEYSFSKRFVYVLLTCNFMRQHYYFGWSVSALCCLMSGLGFSGFDDNMNPKYTLVKNFRFRSVEFAGSIKELIDNWNISTLHWLRLVVFDRLPRKWANPGVFVVSCIWHGFYPGYYMFFLSMGYFFYLSRVYYRSVRPKLFKRFLGGPPPEHTKGQNWLERTSVFTNLIMPTLGFPVSTESPSKQPGTGNALQFCQRYDFVTWAITYTVVNYSATAFVMLAFQDSLVVWSRFFFIVHLCAIVFHLTLVNNRIIRY